MSHILLNIILGLGLGGAACLLKVPFRTSKSVTPFTYLMFFVGGFIIGFLLLPIVDTSNQLAISLVTRNPMIFATKAFKVVVGLGTAGAFLAGFKIGKWEI